MSFCTFAMAPAVDVGSSPGVLTVMMIETSVRDAFYNTINI